MVEEGGLSDHKPKEYGAVVKEDWLPDLKRRGGEVVEEGAKPVADLQLQKRPVASRSDALLRPQKWAAAL